MCQSSSSAWIVVLIVIVVLLILVLSSSNSTAATSGAAGAARGCVSGRNIFSVLAPTGAAQQTSMAAAAPTTVISGAPTNAAATVTVTTTTAATTTPATTAPTSPPTYYVRVAHAAPSITTPVAILVNGTPTFANLTYGSVTDYAALKTNNATIGISVNGSTVGSVPFAVPAIPTGNVYYTVGVLPPAPGAVLPVSTRTLNDTPVQGGTGVRFYHFTPKAAQVDLYANGKLYASNIPYGSSLSQALPAGTYSLVLVVAGSPYTSTTAANSPTIVYKNDNVVVNANQMLSIFAEGTTGLQVVTKYSSI
jgi:hypothetical protein